MSIRKQVYLEESDQKVLRNVKEETGLSESELIRRAIREQYGEGRSMSWEQLFEHSVRPQKDPSGTWVYDSLLDDGIDPEANREDQERK